MMEIDFVQQAPPNKMSNWNSVEGGFCEQIIDGFPEKANSITSWFIFCIGALGLANANSIVSVINPLYSLVYSSIMINGIASFLFHYYGYSLYGSFDGISMLVATWTLNHVTWSVLFRRASNRYRAVLNTLTIVVINTCFVLSTSATNNSGFPLSFTAMFAIPVIIIVLLITYLLYTEREPYSRIVIKYTCLGFLLMIIAATLWLKTEPRCDENKKTVPRWFAYMHAVWHVGFSWGSYLTIQGFIMFSEHSTVLYTTKRWFRWIVYLFPILIKTERIMIE